MAEAKRLEIKIEADASGFKKTISDVKKRVTDLGTKGIKLKLDGAAKELAGITKVLEDVRKKASGVFKIDIATDEAKAHIADLRDKLAESYAQLDKLNEDAKITFASGDSDAINEATQQINDMLKQIKDMEKESDDFDKHFASSAEDVRYTTEALEKLRAEIESSKKEAEDLQSKMSVLGRTEGTDSGAYLDTMSKYLELQQQIKDNEEKLAKGYDDSKTAFEDYQSALGQQESAEQNYNSIADAAENAEKKWGAVGTAIGALKGIANGVGTAIKGIAKGITAPFKKLFSSLRNSIKKIGQAFTGAFIFSVVSRKFNDLQKTFENILGNNPGLQKALANLGSSLQATVTPLINALMPVLERVVSIISVLMAKVAQLTSSLFGKTIKQTEAEAKALTDVAEAQKLTTAGFDELNQVGGGEESTAVAPSISVAEMAATELEGPFAKIQQIIERLQPVLSKFGEIFNRIWTAAEPIVDAILDAVLRLIDSGAIEQVADLFAQIFEIIAPIVTLLIQELGPVINDLLTMILSAVGDILKEIGPVIVELAKQLLPVIANIIKMLMPLIQAVLNVIVKLAKPIGKILQVVGQLFMGIIEPLMVILEPLIGLIVDVIDLIADWLEPVLNTFADILQFVVGIISGIMKVVSIVISGIMTAVKKLFNFIKPILNGILSFIGTIVNGIIWLINKCIDGLNLISFDIPDWVPIIGGQKFGFNLQHIAEIKMPQFAQGGIVTGPTTALIGEAGPEAVLPLSDTGWMQTLANIMAQTMGGREVTIQVDGKTLAWTTINNINSITRQTGNLPLVLA